MMGLGIIKSIVDFAKNNMKLILVILLVAAVAVAFGYRDAYRGQRAETQKQIDNIAALKDSVRSVENKAGELQQEKLALQSDKEQLKDLNEELSDEVDKQNGKVNQLTQLVGNLQGVIDSLNTDDGERVDTNTTSNIGQYKFTWEKTETGEKWSKVLEGYFVVEADTSYKPKVLKNMVTKDELDMQIVTGIKEVDGKKTIFVRSSYPGLTFTDINGAIIEERQEFFEPPKRWGIGPAIGYGIDGTGNTAPFVGVTIQYSFIRF